MFQRQFARKGVASEREKVVTLVKRGSEGPNVPPPATPSKCRFVPKEDRENWFCAWRNRTASTMALVRRNPGFRQLDIEMAILDELDERERRRERIERSVQFITRRAA
jgi:hypothetical protein